MTLHPIATPRYVINLGSSLARKILDEVADVRPDDLETGGYLWGWAYARSMYTDVVWASGADAGSLHGRRSMLFATEEAARAAMPDWLDPDRQLRRCGDWHLHPVQGSSEPSQADLDVWARFLWKNDRAVLRTYPSVIVYPNGPVGPAFSGWVTRKVGKCRHTTEPAIVDAGAWS